MNVKTVDILGVSIANITQNEALDILQGFLSEEKNHVVVTPNSEGVMQARRNPAFFAALNSANLSLADGMGIIAASRIFNTPLPERVRGVDTAFALFEKLNKQGRDFTAYFLGGKEGVSKKAKKKMEKRFPFLKVVGNHHGFYAREEGAEAKILAEINELSPDILLICTGMPRAEIWAVENKNINTRITMCLGGTLDVMAGNAKLAPAFIRKIGMEWLYRFIRQPSRFFRMFDIPRFVFAVFWKKLFGN